MLSEEIKYLMRLFPRRYDEMKTGRLHWHLDQGWTTLTAVRATEEESRCVSWASRRDGWVK